MRTVRLMAGTVEEHLFYCPGCKVVYWHKKDCDCDILISTNSCQISREVSE